MASMVITTPSTAATIPRPGSESATELKALGLLPSAALHVDIEIHQQVQLMRCGGPDDQHAQRIANEIAGGRVAQELGVAGEDGALSGIFDIRFEGHDAAAALRADENLVEHPQVAKKGCAAVDGRPESPDDPTAHLADDRPRIGHQNDSRGGAHDDQHLRRLHQDVKVAPLQEEAAQDGSEYQHHSGKSKHSMSL
jgi:hypothetical protein